MTDQDTALHIVGIDLSLTATAVAWDDGGVSTYGVSGLTSAAVGHGERAGKLHGVAVQIISLAVPFVYQLPRLVLIEGLPTTGTRVDSERCYVWWEVVRLFEGVPVLSVPPTTLKLYASGLGNANKREVIAAAKRDLPQFEIRKTSKTGRVLTTDDDNKADAAWLVAIGRDLLGAPIVPPAGYRARALEKLELPPGV